MTGPTSARGSGRRRVLVVDDYPDAADMVAEALEAVGHEVAVAYDAEAALEVAATFAPQVALLDLRLPTLNGFELAAMLKQRPEGEKLVLVAMTGLSGREERAKATAAGFALYLVKPIDIAQLGRLVFTLGVE